MKTDKLATSHQPNNIVQAISNIKQDMNSGKRTKRKTKSHGTVRLSPDQGEVMNAQIPSKQKLAEMALDIQCDLSLPRSKVEVFMQERNTQDHIKKIVNNHNKSWRHQNFIEILKIRSRKDEKLFWLGLHSNLAFFKRGGDSEEYLQTEITNYLAKITQENLAQNPQLEFYIRDSERYKADYIDHVLLPELALLYLEKYISNTNERLMELLYQRVRQPSLDYTTEEINQILAEEMKIEQEKEEAIRKKDKQQKRRGDNEKTSTAPKRIRTREDIELDEALLQQVTQNENQIKAAKSCRLRRRDIGIPNGRGSIKNKME